MFQFKFDVANSDDIKDQVAEMLLTLETGGTDTNKLEHDLLRIMSFAEQERIS